MHVYSHRNPKPEKTCGVVRYGALGDVLQASSVFPGLRAQGYHLTFYTTPLGYEVTKLDPYVNRFVVQEVDIIPNHELGSFWDSLEKKHDKFVNLSESVERTLLAMPGNTNFKWSPEMRHKHLNKNYMEFVHDMAGVPMPCRLKFHASLEEKEWAANREAFILWVLSGSAIHKVWPYMDVVMDRVLRKYEGIRFILVGDEGCKKLQEGWEDHPRVSLMAGELSIRQTLALAQVAELVVGPETGVLNAVSMEDVPKIVFLSHSSEENLTKHWVNTTSLHANTSCYPCHRLHMVQDGFKHCNESKVIPGIAACQADLLPGVVEDAIHKIIG
jgi:ADP-heptose:LPS heptosyltransferase